MAKRKKLGAKQLAGKIIDGHAHVGLSLSAYLAGSYPYCQSAEALVRQMDDNGVDFAVAFTLGESVFFDVPRYLADSRRVPASPRLTRAPYIPENRLLCEEIYEKSPASAGRLLPFLIVDPGRHVRRQLAEMERLAEEYPVYGIKCAGIQVQSSHGHLKGKAECFMRFAQERDLPVLLHSTAYPGDRYSHTSINLAVAKAFPRVRFCLAHCLGFDKPHLDEADALPNVWVDSAAMKIQIEPEEILAPPERRFPSDYSDFRKVFRDLARAYPETMIWGSDAPAYSYLEKRRYPDGRTVIFALRGSYELERAALDAVSPAQRRQVANRNTLRFLFGLR